MHPALERLIQDRPPDAAEVDAFVRRHRIPLRDGRRFTFVYRGEAEAVRLRHWILDRPDSQPFQRLEGTELWWLEVELPRRSRIEYKLEVDRSGHTEWIRDPLNPRLAHDPFGANSVLHGEGYVTPDWTRPDPESRPGSMSPYTLDSRALGEPREILLYRPARRSGSGRFPLLIVHDGRDYLRYADLGPVLDNLIERGDIPPMAVALTEPGERLVEYADDPCHARFVAQEIPAFLERELPLEPGPAQRGLMGASLGAVASLAAVWRHPGRFGRLLLQSGSFAITATGPHNGDEALEPVIRLMDRFRRKPGRPAEKAYVSCGLFEPLIHENRALVPWLEDAGIEVAYREVRDGHNWQNWRDRLLEGLSWLFPVSG